MKQDEKDALFDRIIIDRLCNRMVPIQETIKQTYIVNRKTCFSTYGQRWNMLDYLRQVNMISLALVEYVIALVKVFQRGESKERFMKVLDDLEISLDTLRKDNEKSASSNKASVVRDDGSAEPSVSVETRESNLSIPTNATGNLESMDNSASINESQPLLPRGNTNFGL
jgi:hypothetical protein